MANSQVRLGKPTLDKDLEKLTFTEQATQFVLRGWTGVGIALPVISILSAFAGLFGQGGAPLCSMARGRGDNDEASRVMGNAFSMLLVSSVALGLLTWAFLDPVITVFAAGKEASSYAREYLAVYLIGTTFSFVSLGMNV